MTPANVRAVRLRLGLSVKDAAELCGITIDAMERQERAKSITVYLDTLGNLRALESAMEDYIYRLIDANPRVLVGYMNDADLATFEPLAASSLRANAVHRMALAQAQETMRANGHDVQIVEIIPDHYLLFLEHHGLPGDAGDRERWALEKLATFRQIGARE